MLKFRVAIILVFLFVGISCGIYFYPSAISVRGNLIIDEQGTEQVFRGVVAMDPVMQRMDKTNSELPWGEAYYRTMAEWGANIVRIPIHPKSWREYGKDFCISTLEQTIAWAVENQLYVIIDFHSIGFPPDWTYDNRYDGLYQTDMQEIKEFWVDIAKQFKDNEAVAFYEVFNEPVYSDMNNKYRRSSDEEDWLQWRNCVEQIISMIRLMDTEKPIIVGGLSWAYDLSSVERNPIRDGQIVYATHPYPLSSNRKNWETAFGSLKQSYPVFVTEFGYDNSDKYGLNLYKGEGSYDKALPAYLEKNKISWTAWCFSDEWAPCLLKDKYYTPTPYGKMIKELLSRQNGDCCL